MVQPEMSSSPCVVLTATISVQPDMCFTARTDLSTRLNDYKKAFEKWLNNPVAERIVMVENSGFDLSEFASASARVQKEVELLSFRCRDFDGARGKGYGEMLCLEHVLRESKLLRESRHFIKVSGRYYLRNLNKLVGFLETRPETEVVCNLNQNLTSSDSRAFAASVRFLEEYFLPWQDLINDSQGIYFEHVLARATHRLISEGGKWSMMPDFPELEGVQATTNRVYPLNFFKLRTGRALHKLRLRLLRSAQYA